jgi:hypothetical protein
MTTQIADLVRRWFRQADSGSLMLPDGWFGGRAGESMFTLVDVQASGDMLVVYMSQDGTLILDHPRRAYVDAEADLVFEDFDEATFRWKPFGHKKCDDYRYSSGQVRLVAPLRMSMPAQGDLPRAKPDKGSEAG